MTTSGRLGATIAGTAAHMSQQAIDDLSRTGTTRHTVEAITALVPTTVWAGQGSAARALPLEQWHDDVLHDICRKVIVPDVVDSAKSKLGRFLQPELVARLAPDVPVAPPVPADLGDFVAPVGGPAMG